MNDRIKEVQKQIDIEKAKIANCKHDFSSPIFNPETVREPDGYTLIGHGSDVFYEPDGYHNVTKSRWTRQCKICGVEEHTYKQKSIITGYEPEF